MCEQDLAMAVIFQAEKDANIRRDCYKQRTARNFLCGVTSYWRESLDFWAALAGVRAEVIMESSRRKWRPEMLGGKKWNNR